MYVLYRTYITYMIGDILYIHTFGMYICISDYNCNNLSPADNAVVVEIPGTTLLLEELSVVLALRRNSGVLYRPIAVVAIQCYQHGRVHLPHVAVSVKEYCCHA